MQQEGGGSIGAEAVAVCGKKLTCLLFHPSEKLKKKEKEKNQTELILLVS